MNVRIKVTAEEQKHDKNYIEIDLTPEEMEGIKKGIFPVSKFPKMPDRKLWEKDLVISIGNLNFNHHPYETVFQSPEKKVV